jgi:hypothetical protein
MAVGVRDRGVLAEAIPADVAHGDATLDRPDQERLSEDPGGEWRLALKAEGPDRPRENAVTTFIDGVFTNAPPGKLFHGTD